MLGFVLSGYRPRPEVVDEIRRADLFACSLTRTPTWWRRTCTTCW